MAKNNGYTLPSHKGNPYHDAKGRFTTADGVGKGGTVSVAGQQMTRAEYDDIDNEQVTEFYGERSEKRKEVEQITIGLTEPKEENRDIIENAEAIAIAKRNRKQYDDSIDSTSASTTAYIKALEDEPNLSPKKEAAYGLVAQNENLDDEKRADARNRIVMANAKHVVALAKRKSFGGTDLGEVVGVGMMSLNEAVDKYDPSKGNFWAYAKISVESAMIDELGKRQNDSSLSKNDRNTVAKIKKAKERFYAENGSEPTSEELADITGLSQEKINKLSGASERGVSFDSNPVTSEGRGLDETIADPKAPDPEKVAIQQDLKNTVGGIFSSLINKGSITPKEKDILMEFMNGNKAADVAERHNITAKEASKIRAKVLKKIAESGEAKKLKAFLYA